MNKLILAAICAELTLPAFKVADAPLNCVSLDTISVLMGTIPLLTGLSSQQSVPI